MAFPSFGSRRCSERSGRRSSTRVSGLSGRGGVRSLSVEPLEERVLLAAVPVMLSDSLTFTPDPNLAVQVADITYFAAKDTAHGVELWKTDGTVAGTSMVKDIYDGSVSSEPASLVEVGGKLFFTAYEATHGRELWVSDGTEAGTVLVSDIYAGSVSSDPQSLLNVAGTLLFTAYESTHGRELWTTDGTTDGTTLVKDIYAGSVSSDPQGLIDVRGTLFFSAYEAEHGRELWKSDGSSDGTELVWDIRAGSVSSSPENLTELAGRLLFSADDGVHGRQLWILPPTLTDESYVATVDETLTVDAAHGVLGNDPELSTAILVEGPSHGAVVLDADGSFNYTPAPGFSGTDTFTYRASDGNGLTNIATASLYVAEPLGPTVYRQFDVAASAAGTWYSFETARDGVLSLQATVETSGTAKIELYGEDLTTPLAVSTAAGGHQRIDWEVEAGQQYYARLTGNSTAIDFRLANMVFQAGNEVFVLGSDGDDQFRLDFGTTHVLTVNGIDYAYAAASASAFYLDGVEGSNSTLLLGGGGRDVARLWPEFRKVFGQGYEVQVTNSADVVFEGRGGDDVAWLYGTAGDERLEGNSLIATLTGDGFTSTAIEVETVRALGGDGRDEAWLYGSDGNDRFEAGPVSAQLSGDGYLMVAGSFEAVHAYGRAGNDLAIFHDSAGDEVFQAWPTGSRMFGDGFARWANGFEVVRAYASEGDDRARLFDSAGDEVFRAWPTKAQMVGDSFRVLVSRFSRVVAVSTEGGNDIARLFGSSGNDVYAGTPDRGQLSGSGFSNRAVNFAIVQAFAGDGDDEAVLSDSIGKDKFVATPDFARFFGAGFSHRLTAFNRVIVNSTEGGDDDAYFTSSTGPDLLEAQSNSARLSIATLDYLYEALGFNYVRATAGSAASHKHVVDPLSFTLDPVGPWQDI